MKSFQEKLLNGGKAPKRSSFFDVDIISQKYAIFKDEKIRGKGTVFVNKDQKWRKELTVNKNFKKEGFNAKVFHCKKKVIQHFGEKIELQCKCRFYQLLEGNHKSWAFNNKALKRCAHTLGDYLNSQPTQTQTVPIQPQQSPTSLNSFQTQNQNVETQGIEQKIQEYENEIRKLKSENTFLKNQMNITPEIDGGYYGPQTNSISSDEDFFKMIKEFENENETQTLEEEFKTTDHLFNAIDLNEANFLDMMEKDDIDINSIEQDLFFAPYKQKGIIKKNSNTKVSAIKSMDHFLDIIKYHGSKLIVCSILVIRAKKKENEEQEFECCFQVNDDFYSISPKEGVEKKKVQEIKIKTKLICKIPLSFTKRTKENADKIKKTISEIAKQWKEKEIDAKEKLNQSKNFVFKLDKTIREFKNVHYFCKIDENKKFEDFVKYLQRFVTQKIGNISKWIDLVVFHRKHSGNLEYLLENSTDIDELVLLRGIVCCLFNQKNSLSFFKKKFDLEDVSFYLKALNKLKIKYSKNNFLNLLLTKKYYEIKEKKKKR